MNHLDLFSGIRGFALAAQWVWGEEHNIHSFVENEPFCQKVLKKHWPDVPIYSDIRDYKHDGTAITILTGGFPCQPFSCAGKQGGKKDNRYLWPEMLQIIKNTKPDWVIAENVTGIVNMELDTVLSDLEAERYETAPFIIPACAVDAPHRRDRVWIVANSDSSGRGKQWRAEPDQTEHSPAEYTGENVADTPVQRSQVREGQTRKDRQAGFRSESANEPGRRWLLEPGFCRVASRFSSWLDEPEGVPRIATGISDRVNRLKALGNSIVPQVVKIIMEGIKEIENNYRVFNGG